MQCFEGNFNEGYLMDVGSINTTLEVMRSNNPREIVKIG